MQVFQNSNVYNTKNFGSGMKLWLARPGNYVGLGYKVEENGQTRREKEGENGEKSKGVT